MRPRLHHRVHVRVRTGEVSEMIQDTLMVLFHILVFPGLLFVCVCGLLLAGIDRKVLAHMQKRVGPPIVQPLYDFLKLMGKETIVPQAANRTVFLSL